jgi:predicted transcriptional regulator
MQHDNNKDIILKARNILRDLDVDQEDIQESMSVVDDSDVELLNRTQKYFNMTIGHVPWQRAFLKQYAGHSELKAAQEMFKQATVARKKFINDLDWLANWIDNDGDI